MTFKRLARLQSLATCVLLLAAFSGASLSATEKRTHHFKLVEHICESGCSDTYESSSGDQVSFVLACYTATPGDARAELNRLFGEGRIVSKRRGLGKQRRSERTVLVQPPEDGKTTTTIYWYRRGESCFSFIQAGSFKLAVEFEQSRAAAKSLSDYR
jgi:hypothetical protein